MLKEHDPIHFYDEDTHEHRLEFPRGGMCQRCWIKPYPNIKGSIRLCEACEAEVKSGQR